jgi:Cu(I)/Ag(I) efflux system membrane protein CusA/SilA
VKQPLALVWPEFKPRSWEELVAALNEAVQLPGTTNAWVFPIKTRIDMLTTGIRTPIGIKVFGDDLKELERIAVEIEGRLQKVSGTRSVIAERSLGGYYLDISLKRENLAAYGLAIEDANMLIEGAIGGMPVTTILDGRKRFPLNVRYAADFRSDPERLKRALVTTMEGRQIPLAEIADIRVTNGPSMIKDENGLLTAWVFVDLMTGTDMSDYVGRVDRLLRQSGLFKSGYTYKISGQYEFMQRANARLMVVVPLTLLVILLLLYWNTRSWAYTGLIFLAVPFSLIGAFWILYIVGYQLSIAVWVGIIALAGVDAETGVVMLLYLDLAYKHRREEGRLKNSDDLREAVIEGAVKRLRPKLMTVLTMAMGLLPILWASPFESGADVAKRIAAPMVGGIFTSFILELFIYPCIFTIWKSRGSVENA